MFRDRHPEPAALIIWQLLPWTPPIIPKVNIIFYWGLVLDFHCNIQKKKNIVIVDIF
jgi:hypothetical protein